MSPAHFLSMRFASLQTEPGTAGITTLLAFRRWRRQDQHKARCTQQHARAGACKLRYASSRATASSKMWEASALCPEATCRTGRETRETGRRRCAASRDIYVAMMARRSSTVARYASSIAAWPPPMKATGPARPETKASTSRPSDAGSAGRGPHSSGACGGLM